MKKKKHGGGTPQNGRKGAFPGRETPKNAKRRARGAISVAKEILARTGGGVAFVDYAEKLWLDECLPENIRRWYFEWLADRSLGRAAQVVSVEHQPQDVEDRPLSDDELASLEGILERAGSSVGDDSSSSGSSVH